MNRNKRRSEIVAPSAPDAMRGRRGGDRTLRVEGNKGEVNKAGRWVRATLDVLKGFEEALGRRKELNKWQKRFIVGVKLQFSRSRVGPTLSERQLKKLIEIFDYLGIRGRHAWS